MRKNYGPVYVIPLAAWLAVFFLAPLCIIIVFSFLTKGVYGGVVWRFSLQGYTGLANATFAQISLTTIIISIAATLVMVSGALPAAYYIARSRHRNTYLLLIMIPFWTNFLIRLYAWIAILGNNGLFNISLLSLGIIDDHVQFLYNRWAVITVTVYAYLPFAVLPLYAAIEKFDFSLLEAARDLGAKPLQSIIRVLLPNISAGIVTAVLFTFIPTFGSYAIPQIIGGRDSLMLGNVIARELTITRNWPLSCGISVVLTVITTAGVLILMGMQRRNAAIKSTVVVKEAAL